MSDSVDSGMAGADMSALEARLDAVEKLQRQNMPKFLSVIRRMGKVEKAVAANTDTISAIKVAFDADLATRKNNAEKLDSILAMMTHAKSIGGYVKKWGPRALTFAIGIAVAKGWISAENGHSFLSIFGM